MIDYNLENMETEGIDHNLQILSDFEEMEALPRVINLESQSPVRESHGLYTEKSEDSCGSCTSIYSPIKAEDIHILDLHVDSHLKPKYTLNNKSCVWLGDDSSTEEKKLKGIINYLSNRQKKTTECGRLLRTMSHENFPKLDLPAQGGKRGSVDILDRKKFKCHSPNQSGSVEFSQLCDENSDFKEVSDWDLSKARIIDELEFQTSLKNERCHFMFADMLIESLEEMFSEEYYYQNRHGHNVKVGSTISLTKRGSDQIKSDSCVDSATIHSSLNSGAKSVAMSTIDHTMFFLAQLTAHDGRHRDFPASLKILCSKLEESSVLSLSLDMFRSQRVSSDKQTRSYRTSAAKVPEESQDESVEGKIKAAIGSYTLDLQVGGYPVLGPDMSLPSYVASRSPPASKRTDTLFLQQNKCPGCMCIFLPEIALRLRLCRYFGLYFCSVCHSNTLMILPSRILTKWDFSMFPVCRPARDFLHLIHNVPIFSFSNFTQSLQSSLRVLTSVCRLRRQGRFLLDFIGTCRQGSPLMALCTNMSSHWFSDPPHLFSIADFQFMESGTMELCLKEVVSKYIEHISLCPVCQARGFFCELCEKSSEVIFPFEIDVVSQCAQCGACFHSRCYNKSKSPCPRCERRRVRDLRSMQNDPLDLIIS